ncbi:hypothetical protein KAT80_00330 [Candidatus Pacearchaeota archaeon]|nr:hypothetical protein [Candidatus Pacearchaeota archaeon]
MVCERKPLRFINMQLPSEVLKEVASRNKKGDSKEPLRLDRFAIFIEICKEVAHLNRKDGV